MCSIWHRYYIANWAAFHLSALLEMWNSCITHPYVSSLRKAFHFQKYLAFSFNIDMIITRTVKRGYVHRYWAEQVRVCVKSRSQMLVLRVKHSRSSCTAMLVLLFVNLLHRMAVGLFVWVCLFLVGLWKITYLYMSNSWIVKAFVHLDIDKEVLTDLISFNWLFRK